MQPIQAVHKHKSTDGTKQPPSNVKLVLSAANLATPRVSRVIFGTTSDKESHERGNDPSRLGGCCARKDSSSNIRNLYNAAYWEHIRL